MHGSSTERFSDLEWSFRIGVSHDVLYLAAVVVASLFISEAN
jgi:hypothetical protein